MKIKNKYRFLGLILTLTGAVLTPVFYFIVGSSALAASGISAIIIGLTCIAVADARPYLSPETARMLLEAGMENTSALLEELGLNNKAIYVPSSISDGHPRALIPLSRNNNILSIHEKLPGRLIVRYGTEFDDMAIAVTTPGSVSIGLLENKPESGAGEIEVSLIYLLSGVLDVARGVSVTVIDTQVMIDISEAKISIEDNWYRHCLGSPIASIAASVVSEAVDKPVRIIEETENKGHSKIRLEIIGNHS
jgi:hypothetical protein